MKLNQITPGQKQSTKIDWEEIKSKVTSLQKVIEQKDFLLPEEKRSLFKKRAQALALRENDKTVQQECIEIIVFRLAYETYGIETAFVREVYPLKDITTLPGTPSFVIGIMYNERMEFGVLADIVEGTQSVALKEIMAAPPSAVGIGKKYLKGVTKEHIVLLEAESILNDEKIIVNEKVN